MCIIIYVYIIYSVSYITYISQGQIRNACAQLIFSINCGVMWKKYPKSRNSAYPPKNPNILQEDMVNVIPIMGLERVSRKGGRFLEAGCSNRIFHILLWRDHSFIWTDTIKPLRPLLPLEILHVSYIYRERERIRIFFNCFYNYTLLKCEIYGLHIDFFCPFNRPNLWLVSLKLHKCSMLAAFISALPYNLNCQYISLYDFQREKISEILSRILVFFAF